MRIKYWLDISLGDRFVLCPINPDEQPICSGYLSDIGIDETDPQFYDKLCDYFEREYGILPEEWDV